MMMIPLTVLGYSIIVNGFTYSNHRKAHVLEGGPREGASFLLLRRPFILGEDVAVSAVAYVFVLGLLAVCLTVYTPRKETGFGLQGRPRRACASHDELGGAGKAWRRPRMATRMQGGRVRLQQRETSVGVRKTPDSAGVTLSTWKNTEDERNRGETRPSHEK
eukprot:Gb_22025 [translate_table: standard]